MANSLHDDIVSVTLACRAASMCRGCNLQQAQHVFVKEKE
jgi:hypothetical protein